MKKLLKKLLGLIARLFSSLPYKYRKVIDLSILVVNAIKKVMDSPVDDVIVEIIGIVNARAGTVAGDLKNKLEEILPDLIIKLSLMKEIPWETKEKQVKVILERLNISDDDTQKAFYHSLCSLITESLSDGKISWSESVLINETRYKKLI